MDGKSGPSARFRGAAERDCNFLQLDSVGVSGIRGGKRVGCTSRRVCATDAPQDWKLWLCWRGFLEMSILGSMMPILWGTEWGMDKYRSLIADMNRGYGS